MWQDGGWRAQLSDDEHNQEAEDEDEGEESQDEDAAGAGAEGRAHEGAGALREEALWAVLGCAAGLTSAL